MPENIMFHLKRSSGLCSFMNGKVHPCEYHFNRKSSTIFALTDNSGNISSSNRNQVVHKRTPDIVELAKLFNSGNDPAGGWYLVQEQREWLQKRLAHTFADKKISNDQCKILVAGIASFVHYYTFLEIVITAAKQAKFDLSNITIDIVDKCIYPLLQIASIEENVRSNIFFKKKLTVYGDEIKLSSGQAKFIKNLSSSINKIDTRLFLRDLKELEGIEDLGKYSVITEHFLTSMLNKQIHLISKTRESYSKILESNGHLLVAAGSKNPDYYTSFMECHTNYGLVNNKESELRVWDPYGISKDQIQLLEHNEDMLLVASMDNILCEFIKE